MSAVDEQSSRILTLFCWILDHSKNPFPVDIADYRTVGHLKEAIAKKKPSVLTVEPDQPDHVDADALKIFKVSFPFPADDLDDELKHFRSEHGSEEGVSAVKRLKGVFENPVDEHIHVIVLPPPAARNLNINCIVFGDDPSRVITVKIPDTDNLSALKELIKDKNKHTFRDVDARDLNVWKVDIDLNDDLEASLSRLKLREGVEGIEKLKDTWTNIAQILSDLPSEHLRVVVERPDSDNLPPLPHTWREHRENFKKRKRLAPSQQGQPAEFEELQKDDETFYACSRPLEREPGLPLTLLHRIFGQFVGEAKKIMPTRKDYITAQKLKKEMCDFYPNEGERREKLCVTLREYGIPIHPGNIGASKDSTDGHFCNLDHPMLILELKNEVGSKGAEPSLQALLYYCVFCDEYKLWDDGSTCHPCLIIFLAGTHLGFAGCAVTSRPTMEIFSLLPLDFHSTNDDAYDNLARHLSALKNALDNLGVHIGEVDKRRRAATPSVNTTAFSRRTRSTILSSHSSLSSSTPQDLRVPPIFPHPTTFTHEGRKNSFIYDAEVAGRPLLFKGKTEDNKPICIKFVRRYGKDVHLWCASRGFAPHLIAYEALPGDWYMVVMDLLDDSWVPLSDITQGYAEGFKERFHASISELHQAKMVHGDIRETNVMVKDRGREFMLIDYDWAGSLDEVKYPRLVNKTPALRRPGDVEDGKPILTQHDQLMLENMFR